MVFSSLPLYHLDPQNWHQQSNDQQLIVSTHHHGSTVQLPPPPNHGGGGGPISSMKPNSMVDRARQAQIPVPEAGLKCPRCESINTKFCYFNNYSLSQPRHFCKTCRRYWTRGGALRTVPVGGGPRRTPKRTKGKSSNNTDNNVTSSLSRSTSLFLNPTNLPQLPFLPSSFHHLGNSGSGLSLLDAGGADMEFPLMGSFEGMHPFENSTISTGSFELLQSKPLDLHHEFMIDRVASVKLEDSQRLNLAKGFSVSDNQQYNNWNNNNVWTNTDLSGFTSSSNSHLFG